MVKSLTFGDGLMKHTTWYVVGYWQPGQASSCFPRLEFAQYFTAKRSMLEGTARERHFLGMPACLALAQHHTGIELGKQSNSSQKGGGGGGGGAGQTHVDGLGREGGRRSNNSFGREETGNKSKTYFFKGRILFLFNNF